MIPAKSVDDFGSLLRTLFANVQDQQARQAASQQAQGFFPTPTTQMNVPVGSTGMNLPMDLPSGNPQPNIQAMLSALFSSNPYSQQNAKTALGASEAFQPQYQVVPQSNDAVSLVTKPPFGGKPTIEQVQSPQYKPTLPVGFANLSSDQKAKEWNKVYGTTLTASDFAQPNESLSDNELYAKAAKGDKEAQATLDKKSAEQFKLTQGKSDIALQKAKQLDDLKQQSMSSPTKSMVEVAPTVKDFANRITNEINNIQNKFGVVGSRWNEFWTGKIGTPDPEYAKLRTDVGLLETALMRMHVGARGGQQLLTHFKDLIGFGHQSAENMLSSVGAISDYADRMMAKKTGGTQTFNVNGKIYNIPVDKVDEFKKDMGIK